MTLSVAVRAYATVNGDSVLAEKMNVTESKLRKHRDSVVAQHCQAVLDGEATVVGGLVGDLRCDRRNAHRFPSDDRPFRDRDRCTAWLVDGPPARARPPIICELMKDTTKLLVKRVDALVAQFVLTAPEFVRS